MNKAWHIIIGCSDINRDEWSSFVKNHPNGNIFQSPEYYNIINDAPGHTPIALFCINKEKIEGVLIAAVIYALPPPLNIVTGRSVIWGGPLVSDNNPEIATLLLLKYNSLVKRKALFSQYRNLHDTSPLNESFTTAGYRHEEHLNFIIDISRGEEILWNNIHPTRRKQIRRGYRRGVEVSEADLTVNGFPDTCYKMLKATYKKQGLPLPDHNFFREAVRQFQDDNSLRLFVAKIDGEMAAFRLALFWNKKIYDWYAASDDSYNDKYPNDILPWEIFKAGIRDNYETFDFGGAGKPDVPYGVRDYKAKFGGELVCFGRYTGVHKPLLNLLVMSAFNLRRKLKRVL